MTLVEELFEELENAEELWGVEFDDKNTINDWLTYINGYAGRAYDQARSSRGLVPDNGAVRDSLLKTAGLAISAVKAMDRNGGFPPRHYD